MSLEREYLALVFIVIAVAISTTNKFKFWLRNVIVGLVFGLSATIKQLHTAIGFLPILDS